MNVVIIPIKCIYGANKHNIVIGSWQKWKWQWASEKMLLAEQNSDWAAHKSLGSVLCFPSVVKLQCHWGGKGVLLALSAQVHPQHKHTPTSIWASLDIIPAQNIMCCMLWYMIIIKIQSHIFFFTARGKHENRLQSVMSLCEITIKRDFD